MKNALNIARVFLALALLVLVFVTASDQALQVPIALGFLGFVGKAISGVAKGIGAVAKGVGKAVGGAVKVTAGIAAGVTGLDAILKGGQVQAQVPGQQPTIIIAGQQPVGANGGFLNQVMAFRVFGLPVIPILAVGGILWFIAKRGK